MGATTPVPTGVALTALASTVTFFHMGLLHTVGILGLLVIGYLGIWRLAGLFPTARARIAALVVYAAVPLPSQLLSSGRWGALACYATAPWVVHLLRRSAGIESFDRVDVTRADSNRADGYTPIPARARLRLLCQLALLTAITFAFVPSFARLGPVVSSRRRLMAIRPDPGLGRSCRVDSCLSRQPSVGLVVVRTSWLGPDRRRAGPCGRRISCRFDRRPSAGCHPSCPVWFG